MQLKSSNQLCVYAGKFWSCKVECWFFFSLFCLKDASARYIKDDDANQAKQKKIVLELFKFVKFEKTIF